MPTVKFMLVTATILLGLGSPAPVRAQSSANAANRGTGPSTDATAPKVATDPSHVLQPQDLLRVSVFQEKEINDQCQRVPVSQESTITLPLIGQLDVKGKTVGQVQTLIRDLYNKDYLVNPQVSVLVLEYAERSVNIMGSVTNQGRIEFPDLRGLSIVDALALAGGQTRFADLKRVKLTRTNDDGEREVTDIDVDAMMKKQAQPFMLKPGDVVFVPERVL